MFPGLPGLPRSRCLCPMRDMLACVWACVCLLRLLVWIAFWAAIARDDVDATKQQGNPFSSGPEPDKFQLATAGLMDLDLAR